MFIDMLVIQAYNIFLKGDIMPWITRCSKKDIQCGTHINPDNCILIQINDNCTEPPKPYYRHLFKLIYQFEFMDLDVEDEDSIILGITKNDAKNIADIIKYCFTNNINILVHCVMGVSRSGGVCEAAEAFGFEYIRPDKINCPNILVKSSILKILNNR